jgi:hypothetical protein
MTVGFYASEEEILYIAINLLMILSIQNLSKKYRKEKFGLKDYSITIENGILVCSDLTVQASRP